MIHVSASRQFPAAAGTDTGSLLQHLTQTDVFLDAETFLPSSIVFNTHPDNNASLDIRVEMRFSEYRVVSGVQIPFHVQRFINNCLALDLQFTTATLNSGVSASSFEVQ